MDNLGGEGAQDGRTEGVGGKVREDKLGSWWTCMQYQPRNPLSWNVPELSNLPAVTNVRSLWNTAG